MVLSVGPGILIPRPETEQMIDYVAEAASANPMLSHGVWADLGTGSGALAIGVARQLLDVSKVTLCLPAGLTHNTAGQFVHVARQKPTTQR